MNTPTKATAKFKPKFDTSISSALSKEEFNVSSRRGIKEHQEYSDLVAEYLVSENRDFLKRNTVKVKRLFLLSVFVIVIIRIVFF